MNYVVYHLHSDLSNGVTNIDSVTKYTEYIEYAKSLGMKALGFSEHGSVFEHIKKKEIIEKAGMKYIHGEEFYVTEALIGDNGKKIKDNYHVVLMAKNYDGYLELNKLSSIAFNRGEVIASGENDHFYYVPRITFDELSSISDNIILTTACLGGILAKSNDSIKARFISFLSKHKDNCFLEIQHHSNIKQVQYNQYLYQLSKDIGVKLIAGTDTHCLNDNHVKGRAILQKAKDIFFEDEVGWDLTFKSYDELIECYRSQNALPEEVYLEAINNTNLIADMITPWEIDRSYKYPRLWTNSEAEFKKRINQGAKNRGILKFPNYKEYKDRILYEYEGYKHNGAIDFMLLMSDIINWCNNHNIKVGYGRGSVNGSVIAWLLGITEMDSIKYNLNYERFMNKERVSLSDVDTDFPSSRREEVKDYIFNKEGLYCCDIITFNTIALRGAIRDVARALEIPLDKVNGICDLAETNIDEAHRQYPDLFEYVDIVNGTIVSVGTHPCGCVTSPFSLDNAYGLCTTATSNRPVSQIYMKEIDSVNLVKLDLLNLDTIELINNTCELIGIERFTPDNIDLNDKKVWESIREDTTLIFQWESDSAQAYIKQLMSDNTIAKMKENGANVDMITLFSIGNGAIRPAGASYRDELARGEVRKTGCQPIDDFLADTSGFLVFQCQIIGFLHKFCGFTMGEADIVRRGFAKKTGTEQFIPVIVNGGYLNDNHNHHIKGFIQTMKEDYDIPKEKAEKDIEAFIKVIEDASLYLFSLNHSQPYSIEGYVSGYLRYYYPVEFLTTALNIHNGNEEKTNKITAYAKKRGISISPIKFRHSGANYVPNAKDKTIYKGLSSLKYFNSVVGDTLYSLRDIQFPTFIDFLRINPCDSRQTIALIKLNFFSEFGKSQYLLDIYNIYDKYGTRKQLNKADCPIDHDTMLKFATETEKQYKITDSVGFLAELCNRVENKDIPVEQLLDTQAEFMGYIDYIDKNAQNVGYVLNIDKKYSPKIEMYLLATGETVTYKLAKKDYAERPFKDHILLRFTADKRNKSKLIEGKWVKQPDEFEFWINNFALFS